jgi:cellulose synthase (UDP-forming)
MTSFYLSEATNSFPGNSRSSLKRRTLLFRFIAEINLIFGAWYLYWRIHNSVNMNALWLSIPLLFAEIYSYIGGVMFTIGLWRPIERRIKSLHQLTPIFSQDNYPQVDIFITCYNEAPELVEQTARAALEVDYPPTKLRVYVLDDGNSPDMRMMTENLSLEDLQCPLLQVAADKIDKKHFQLVSRLEELDNLALSSQNTETWLNRLSSGKTTTTDTQATSFVQNLRQLLLWFNPESQNIEDALASERQNLQQAIHQQELELVNLARLHYIARPKPKGLAHHAKAGNLNYAIFSGETSGEFILTLDADHIPKPQFLKRVLPHFYNYNLFTGKYEANKIAFVQTPQDFYNLPDNDPFAHNAHLFYGPIQQGKDGMNSAFYTGTNAILRREALVNVGLQYFSDEFAQDKNRLNEFQLVGGMSSNSITEDMNTAMRLHAAGWQSIYHHELLAEGLAPDDLSSTLKQRLRWAQGTIQVLVRENPLTKSGLTFWQRLHYFQTMYSYFSGFITLIFLSCPIIFFFTGISPVKTLGFDFTLHFVPTFILNRLTFMVVTWGIPAKEVWRSEQYAFALFPLLIQAVTSVFTRKSINFQVTPKQRQSGIYYQLILPQITIVALTILGMLWSLCQLAIGRLEHPENYLVNGFWSIYNLCLMWSIISAAFWKPQTEI